MSAVPSGDERARFDRLVDEVVAGLPPIARRVLDRVAVVVLDRPTRDMLDEVAPDEDPEVVADELCGLHTGTADIDESIEFPTAPSMIHLFRVGIVGHAGGWDRPDADATIREEIRITLLHEIGHQYGLDEDDLAGLGYD